MGVPKFFRYISERYPCLSEVVREYQLPEFDNLYLDMNGIIHVCSHPNDTDPHFRITEEQIFRDIFHYIEALFRMIQPQKLFFMAVDGVAPRAKMNQQRGRRFRSAKEAESAENLARLKGEELPSAERFDSNCITPGTEFMTRLQAQLKYFVTYKISTDKLWQKAKVILSGHETPGEGEHKIMDYIRYMKSQPDYDPNTRHCLYGLDADLIMLGLCTHEPHFSLLREEVKYGKKNNQKRIPTPEETTFFLLHLSLMRYYLDLEFQELKTVLPFPYNLENIIDDWVLMGFLVGNDFIPHLPDLHINKGALPLLYKTYIEVLPTLGGYINEGGSLNLERFQKYMEKLAAFDFEQFKETNADLKEMEARTGRKMGGRERHSYKKQDVPSSNMDKDLAALIAATEEFLTEAVDEDDNDSSYEDLDSDEEDEDDTTFAEFSAMKNNYYREKLEYAKVTPEVLRSQGEGYVRAIQWNLNYYYNGCCSWSWFYPHHYAPYISDVKNFSKLELEYEPGKPFLPFQQLLAVLPAASKKLLPTAYHDLMEDDESPIIQFYPTEFKTDLNGKRQEWEAVVLIPFIEQESLLKAMETKEHLLSEEERLRNKHGPMQVYTYSPQSLGSYIAPDYFPALANHHAKEENVYREEIAVDNSKLVKGLCPGVCLDVYFPGFPTLGFIEFTAKLSRSKVKIFESPSQGDNMILTLTKQSHPDVDKVAENLIGKVVFVNWPHLFEARVTMVSSKEKRYVWDSNDSSIVCEDLNKALKDQWRLSEQAIRERYFSRMGIEVGETEILVYACTLEDKKFVMTDDKMLCEKQWSRLPVAYALQTIKANIKVYEPSVNLSMTLDELFSPDTTVFVLESQYYGVKGKVEGMCKNNRVKVLCEIEPEPNVKSQKNSLCRTIPKYVYANVLSQKLSLTPHLLSRITGTIYVVPKNMDKEAENKSFKLNLGLNLKFSKRNEEVSGYSRRDKNGFWMYSERAEEEMIKYMKAFPEVFDYLKANPSENVCAEDIYPENTTEKLAALGTWLKALDSHQAERQSCGAQVLEVEVVAALEKLIDDFFKTQPTTTTKSLFFKPSTLYLPKPKLGQAPDPRAVHFLFDRVVNVRESYTVPLGAKGTIIGIHDADKGLQAMYEVLFDKEFTGGLKLRCSPNRGYRLPAQAFINISYGNAEEASKSPTKSIHVENTGSPHQSRTEDSWRKKPQVDSPVEQTSRNRSSFNQGQALAPQQLSSEYQAMFKQLQVASSGTKGHMKGSSHQTVDPSKALKKMLKIADDSGKKTSQPDNRSPMKISNSFSYCAQLLALHQRLGMKLPKYLYSDTRDGTIICTVVCGNTMEFRGVPAYANDPAAESAAQAALHFFGTDIQRGPANAHTHTHNPRSPFQPPQRYGFVNRFPVDHNSDWRKEPAKPSTLPPPPTNWCQNPGIPSFQPDWARGHGHSSSFSTSSQYQHNKHVPQHNSMQYRPPFTPLQIENKSQQPHTLRDRRYEEATHMSTIVQSENMSRPGPPSSGSKPNTGRSSTRPPRPRLAANFNKPLTFG